MPAAARATDMHSCPAVSPIPHVGGPIIGPGAPSVLVNGLVESHAIDIAVCLAAIDSILFGSPTVYVGGKMATRVDDPSRHAGKITSGSPNVLIGGPTATVTLSGGVMTVTWGGMTITGSPDDVATFARMLNEDATNTNAGRRYIAMIVNDTAHPITCNVGRSQPGVVGDSFGSNAVDLDDFEQFPTNPSSGHPNEATRGEEMIHFLTERHDEAVNHNGFSAAHNAGIDAQNQVRAERGQSPVVSQVVKKQYPDGSVDASFHYADGTHEDMHIDSNGNITNITPP